MTTNFAWPCCWLLLLLVSSCRLQVVSSFNTAPPISRRPTRLDGSFFNQFFTVSPNKLANKPAPLLQDFVTRWNDCQNNDDDDAPTSNSIESLLDLFADDNAIWNDYSFNQVCRNKLDIERRFRLLQQAQSWPTLLVDESSVVLDDGSDKLAFLFRYNQQDSLRGCAFMTLDIAGSRIQTVDWIMEGAIKGGEASLQTLALASKVIGLSAGKSKAQAATNAAAGSKTKNMTPPERYFEAWNGRDMEAAVDLFADDVVYDDTAFSTPFDGKDKLRDHLLLVAKALPPSFAFMVDDIAVSGGRPLAVRWHVENNGNELPFTQGCSIYKLDGSNKIQNGIDFVSPGPVKTGSIALLVDTMTRQIQSEPVRLIPIATWLVYMYVVFLSDGILPGANALVLEQRTWQEVLNLSLNFFLVAPLLHLPFSPVVHPMLEGVFNLLLSWAAMFAGFLSDDRRDKPNLFPMLPAVAGMQFLTSAFLLPYLATRSEETRSEVTSNDLGSIAQVCENPLLGLSMGFVGSGSIAWLFCGRMAEFGELSERWTTFLDLLSIDRVGSSFIVDLAIFAMFQGWLVDDDLKRRCGGGNTALTLVAKYVPFFGMAAYLIFRPSIRLLPVQSD